MKKSEVVQWLLNESETVLTQSNYVSLSNEANHVDVASPSLDHPYPFIGVQKLATNTRSAGIGNGDVFVDSLNYGSDDVLDSITYRREATMEVEVIPVTDDDPELRDDLSEEVADHFSLYSRTGGQPVDMDPPDVDDETTRGRPSDFIDTSGVALSIDYEHTFTDIDIEVGDLVTDLEQWGIDGWGEEDWGADDPVAFSETF